MEKKLNENSALKPRLGLAYSRLDVDKIVEIGPSVYNLVIDRETYDSLIAEIGVDYEVALDERFALNAGLAYKHELMDNDYETNVLLAGNAFSQDGSDLNDGTIELKAGVTGGVTENTDLSLEGAVSDRDGDTGSSLLFNVRMSF